MKIKITILLFVILFAVQSRESKAEQILPQLLNHAAGDITNTFLSYPAFVIAGGIISSGSIYPYDENIQGHFRNGKKLGKFDTVADYMGKPYVIFPFAIGTFGTGVLFKNEGIAFLGENLTEALLFNEAMTGGLKIIFNRHRPNGGKYSFPSAHSSTWFTIATVFESLYGPVVGIPSYLLAGMIAFSRVDSNSHFVSDVVFGAALGTAIGWGTTRFHLNENQKFFISPMVGSTSGLSVLYRF